MFAGRYRGKGRPPKGVRGETFPYLADKGLVDAVNMAVELERPLLVKGPPGCGKTKLARAVAHELGHLKHKRYYEWHVKSTSRARDGLYTIDMVRRLHDANLAKTGASEGLRLTDYIQFGALGEAIRLGEEAVVLIDEIDKADIDFPNDLLREIEEKKFTVEELRGVKLSEKEKEDGFKQVYETQSPPVIIITSNDEKELPDAFLRRCLFYYIDFPERDELIRIVRLNNPEYDSLTDGLIANAADRLVDFRKIKGYRKEPATSELIDWVRILHTWGVEPERLAEGLPLDELPGWEFLFKHQDDLTTVRQHAKEAAAQKAATKTTAPR
jgi:MoxR-like ATPase